MVSLLALVVHLFIALFLGVSLLMASQAAAITFEAYCVLLAGGHTPLIDQITFTKNISRSPMSIRVQITHCKIETSTLLAPFSTVNGL